MFGLKQFGNIMGLTHTAKIIPMLIGPIMAGLIFDSTDGYNLMFAITFGILIVSILSFLMARVPTQTPRS
jgi:MFS family permease